MKRIQKKHLLLLKVNALAEERSRFEGVIKKLELLDLEEEMILWITKRKWNILHVCCRMIMSKTLLLEKEKRYDDDQSF